MSKKLNCKLLPKEYLEVLESNYDDFISINVNTSAYNGSFFINKIQSMLLAEDIILEENEEDREVFEIDEDNYFIHNPVVYTGKDFENEKCVKQISFCKVNDEIHLKFYFENNSELDYVQINLTEDDTTTLVEEIIDLSK